MADMVTRQELEAAKVDVKHAGEAINAKKVITPRYGQPFKSIPLLSEEFQQILNNKDMEAGQKLQALQDVIDIALAAGAGAAGWTASLVVGAGGKNQQEINDFGGAEWWSKPGGYNLGATVKLENGDIVKSTVDGNVENPNVDITGWVRTTFTAILPSVSALSTYKNPKDGELFEVISYSSGWALEVNYAKPIGGGSFIFKAGSTLAHDGGSVINATNANGKYIRLKTGVVCFEDFGADRTGLTDSTTQITNCIAFAIKNKSKVNAQNSYLIDSVNVSAIVGSLDLNLTGTIKRKNFGGAGDLINLGDKESIKIYGGGVIDFNFQNQTFWSDGITADSAKILNVQGIICVNVKKTAIYAKSRNFDSIVVKSNIFKEGALHSGTASQFCTFLLTRGGKSVNVKCNKFIQNTSSAPNQNRTPCGYLNIDTGATYPDSSFSIKYNYFENLGMHAAANLLSPLDFYSYADQIEIAHNKFRLCNLTPARISSGKNISVEHNDIIQTKAQIIDGGVAYGDPAMIAVGLVDRGYATDENDLENALIANNTLICKDVVCRGVSSSSNGINNIFRALNVIDNTIRSSGLNSQHGVYASSVQKVEISGGVIEGFGSGIRFQETSTNSALVADGKALLTVNKVAIKKCGTGIYARDNITNADIVVDSVQIQSSTNLSFTVRNALSLSMINSSLGGQAGDVSNLGAFWFKDNDPEVGAPPVGTSTCAYYQLKDNKGLVNLSSVDISVVYEAMTIEVSQSVVKTVSFPNTSVGTVVLSAFSVYNANLELTSVVSASNTVTVKFKNTGATALNLTGGTLIVKKI